MMRTGSYVVPVFEGRPRLVKPPLLHWIQATLFRAFGPTEMAARLPAALSTLGSMLLLAWAARRRFGEEAAAWSAAIFVTMPMVLTLGKAGTLDALLAVHVLAAVCLDLGSGGEERGSSHGAAIGALLGLAFLVKGPVGVVLPLLVLLAGRTACRWDVVPTLRGALSAAAAWAVVVLPWGLAFLKSVGSWAASETVRREALERYFVGTAHVQPPWFFVQVVAVGFLPWAGPLVVAVVRLVRRRKEVKAKTAIYAAAGLLAGLVFFSLGKGKLPNYILPLAPLAALLVTWELGQELWAPRERNAGSILLTATLLLTCLVLVLAPVPHSHPALAPLVLASAIVFGVGGVAALAGVLARRPRVTYAAGALTMTAFLGAALYALPTALPEPNSAAVLIERTPELRSGRPIVLVSRELPSLTFYLDRVPEKIVMDELEERIGRGDDAVFIIGTIRWNVLPPSILTKVRRINQVGSSVVFEAADESAAKAPP
jgi:4-amino-4-deoxy-L-arabinose transferase